MDGVGSRRDASAIASVQPGNMQAATVSILAEDPLSPADPFPLAVPRYTYV